MLKFSIIFGLLASIVWRTTPTNCNKTLTSINNNNDSINANQIVTTNILNYMDTSARPCENFYQYACGHWYQQYIDEHDFTDTLEMLDYELNKKLLHILKRHISAEQMEIEDSPEGLDDNDLYEKVRVYIKSCKRVKPYNLKKYLQLVSPGNNSNWYILTYNRAAGMRQWEPHNFDWLKALASLRLYGLNGVLIKEEVLPRWDNSPNNSVYLDKPNIAETQPIVSWTAWVEMLLDIGQTKRVANEIARAVHTFEMQLHKLQEIEDAEGVKEMRLSYLQEYLPQIDWVFYLKQLKRENFNLEMTVIIRNLPYMRALVKLLNEVDRATLCNYIMLKFLQFLKQRGPAEINKQECMSSARRALPLALSHIMGEHFFKESNKHNVRHLKRIFQQLKHKFHETLTNNRLQLPSLIVDMLQQKVKHMRLQIGFANSNLSVNFLDNYYENVHLDGNNFYMNQLNLLRHGVERSHESLDIVANITFDYYLLNDWLGGSSTLPYYVKPKNVVIVPYGFLQMPIYQRQLLDVYKYSVLGFALAHELLRGFDTAGIDYDSLGNIMGPSEEISANQRFIQGLRCMQNEAFGKEMRKLNDKLADYEGLRLVFNTYFHGNHATNHTVQFKTDNSTKLFLLHDFNEKQVFFLNFAQFYCGKEYRQIQRKALDELRVLQMFNNFEEFSKAFGCTRRNKTRCRLW